MFFVLLSPFVCFFLHLAIHFSFGIHRRPALAQKCAAWAGLATVCLYVLMGIFQHSSPVHILYLAITAAGFSLFYVQCFNMSETARRIRILTSLLAGKPLTEYRPAEMLEQRLERLTIMGSLVKQGEMYSARPGILLFAAYFFSWLRRIFYG